jgi:hypothetical protein
VPLRGIIDERMIDGQKAGYFSARLSLDTTPQQSSESFLQRVESLTWSSPIDIQEAGGSDPQE